MDTKTLHITSGSSTVTFTSPNTFTFKLPAYGLRTSSSMEVALKQMTMYYSWPNISAAKGNNLIRYTWPLSTGTQTFDVLMADGIYQFSEMQDYLQQVMMSRGHYLIDQYGQPQFYINLTVNSVLYCLSLTCTPLPASLPSGWSYPSGWQSTVALTPQLIVPNGWSQVSGFPIGTYPTTAQSSVYQTNSANVPQITSSTSLNVISNVVDNSSISLAPNVLTTFVVPVNQSPGTLINIQPTMLDWLPMSKENTFSEVTIALTDQLMRPIQIKDPSGFVCILNVRTNKK